MTGTRALTGEERDRLAAGRLLALSWQPYLATALFRVKVVAAPGLRTMAVDPGWRLYVDPDTMAEWGPEVSAGVLLHEVNHLIRDHAGRADAHQVTDRRCWNVAGDAEINDSLVEAGLTLPAGVVLPSKLSLPDGQLAETYYDALRSDDEAGQGAAGGGVDTGGSGSGGQDDPDAGAPGPAGNCGSGAGGLASGWELPADDPEFPVLDQVAADLTRRKVAEDVLAEAAKSRGTVPAGMVRWAEDTLRAPQVPWKKVLAGAIRSALRYRAGQVNYTYSRPARRRSPKVILPALRQPVPSVAVIVDTSGSMSEDDLTTCLSEVQGIARKLGVRGKQLQLIPVDAEAGAAQPVRRVSDIQLTGGGGTDMRAGIAAAEALTPRPDCVVVLTDGFTPWPDQRGACRLVACLVGSKDQIAHAEATFPPPSWARVVHADVNADTA